MTFCLFYCGFIYAIVRNIFVVCANNTNINLSYNFTNNVRMLELFASDIKFCAKKGLCHLIDDAALSFYLKITAAGPSKRVGCRRIIIV